jgi:Rrf2 family transcriptional regulator, iron-sulfur cluster assembly transcription factor
MRLSRASSYAVRAVDYMAAEGEDRLVASHHIAQARGIPEKYLLKVLRPLVSARVLRSVKGPNGGFRLARPAAKITLLEVVEAVDGPIFGTAGPVGTGSNALDARLEAICNHTADRLRRHLGKVRLADLSARG